MGQQNGTDLRAVTIRTMLAKEESTDLTRPAGGGRSKVRCRPALHFWGFVAVGLQLALILLGRPQLRGRLRLPLSLLGAVCHRRGFPGSRLPAAAIPTWIFLPVVAGRRSSSFWAGE